MIYGNKMSRDDTLMKHDEAIYVLTPRNYRDVHGEVLIALRSDCSRAFAGDPATWGWLQVDPLDVIHAKTSTDQHK